MLNGGHAMNRISFSPRSAQRGVVLIEAMVAILLFSIGVLAVAGLQASMIRNTGDAKYRADASYIAQQKIGQMWADLGNADAYIVANEDISALLPGGQRTVTKSAIGQYTVTITWKQPGDSQQHNYTVFASIVPSCYAGC
jgi:type IV pilus assembly protein PilV